MYITSASLIRTKSTERGEMSEYNPDEMDGERGKCPNTIRTEWTERGEERERQREHYG